MRKEKYQPSYAEMAILSEMFETEIKVRGIHFNGEEQKTGAFLDYVAQYIEDQDTDPHINCCESVTCEKEIHEIDWSEVW